MNIISLCNGFIPIVAIQANAIQIGDQITLLFTVVLDHRHGLAPEEFVIFRPKKTSLGVEPKLKKAEEIETMLDSAGLDVLEYDTRNQRYRIHFSKDEIQKHERLIKELVGRASTRQTLYQRLASFYLSSKPYASSITARCNR